MVNKIPIIFDYSTRLTGAGVTSGIYLGLLLVGLLCGEAVAKMAELTLDYNRKPPFNREGNYAALNAISHTTYKSVYGTDKTNSNQAWS